MLDVRYVGWWSFEGLWRGGHRGFVEVVKVCRSSAAGSRSHGVCPVVGKGGVAVMR